MYYLDTVKQLGGSPLRCRCHLGTENSKLEELQTFFTVFNVADAAESIESTFLLTGRQFVLRRYKIVSISRHFAKRVSFYIQGLF